MKRDWNIIWILKHMFIFSINKFSIWMLLKIQKFNSFFHWTTTSLTRLFVCWMILERTNSLFFRFNKKTIYCEGKLEWKRKIEAKAFGCWQFSILVFIVYIFAVFRFCCSVFWLLSAKWRKKNISLQNEKLVEECEFVN